MCTVSDKLKLCTCKIKNVERLKHYWVLSSQSEPNFEIVGLIILSEKSENDIERDFNNSKRLEAVLNEGNCFDVDIPISMGDILELNFTCKPNSNTDKPINLTYYFIYYKNNKWIKHQDNSFFTDKIEKCKGKIVKSFSV